MTARPSQHALARVASDPRIGRFLAFGSDVRSDGADEILNNVDGMLRRWEDTHGIAEPTDDELADRLRSTVHRSLSMARRHHPDAQVTLGLSGGYDSRPLLVMLRELGEKPVLYTFGQPGNIDYDVVSLIDEHLQLDVHWVNSSTITWTLDEFDAEAIVTSDLPLSPRVPAARVIDEYVGPRLDLHGLMNGALTGAGTSWDHEPWEAQVTAFIESNDPFGFQAILGRDRVRDLLPRDIISPDRRLSAYRQLEMVIRQWNRIMLPERPGRTPVYPYVADDWIGLWLTRPREHIINQRRWLQFIRSLPREFFPDIVGLDGDRWVLRRARLERLYGSAGVPGLRPVPTGITAPSNPTHHFDLSATARNNASFAALLTESLRRLRGRKVVDTSFIDDVEHRFASGDALYGRMMNGLVTLDTCLESGRFTS